jgi:hypothetical protein
MWIHDNIVEYAIDYSKCELCYLENIWRHQIYEAHTINVRLALYNLLPDSIILCRQNQNVRSMRTETIVCEGLLK